MAKIQRTKFKRIQKVYDLLGSKFDSWNGEAFYSDKMSEIVEILEKSGKLIESEGAKIIDLEDKGIKYTMYNRKEQWFINICNKRFGCDYV